MKIGDRVVWLDSFVTPALRGGVWIVEEIEDEIAIIARLDKEVPKQSVKIKNLVKAIPHE